MVRTDEMSQVDVNDLYGHGLDWAVARAINQTLEIERDKHGHLWLWRAVPDSLSGEREVYSPTCNYAQGGPLIDEAGIASRLASTGVWYAIASNDLGDYEAPAWHKRTARGGERYGKYSFQVRKRQQRYEGPTRLVAALRTFVASRLGPSVALPSILVQEGGRNAPSSVTPGPRNA